MHPWIRGRRGWERFRAGMCGLEAKIKCGRGDSNSKCHLMRHRYWSRNEMSRLLIRCEKTTLFSSLEMISGAEEKHSYWSTAVQSFHIICWNGLAPLSRPALPAEAILRLPDGAAVTKIHLRTMTTLNIKGDGKKAMPIGRTSEVQ